MLIKKTVHDFVEIVDSNEPVPGGGSVSALAGTIGAALSRMVGSLTFNKKAFKELPEETQNLLKENSEKLEALKKELEEIVDKDANAFDKVMEAFAMPKDTEEQKEARMAAVQEGYKIALEVPKRCADACMEVIELQEAFAKYGTKGAVSDIGVGILMASSGLEGAVYNVLINLQAMKDQEYIDKTKEEMDALIKKMYEKREALLKIIYERLN
ncbi:cyclodeaminase/cyclohydrolase family protein [Microaceticoccus formicicus]|uniref:cyclodeaminase/cyclohydrolase family protein n=1 Tax=Microaceticoccus formicicus TaxID=3118105 RepID=UPI003CD00326|nr:cyclodeaminase/cyclohydrolase family protein [Peptoniphilaceae bacterium AMB_02]